jgi:tetratricopeptide (TPR) repeat protein
MEYLIRSSTSQTDHIEIDEILARYHNIKGTRSADNGKIKDALDEFSRAIKIFPLFSPAYFNRGTIKADLGDLEGAKSDFNKARELEHKSISVFGFSFSKPY